MQLELNGKSADLPATTTGLIRLQKSVAALSDLETRTGEYSWAFTLPNTRRNAGIFGPILHAQTLDKFVKAVLSFRLRAGGEEWTGFFQLLSLKNGYTGTLSTDSLGWATGLADKKLPDLATLAPVPYDGSQLESILQKNCDKTDLQFPLVAYHNFYAPPTQDEDGNDVPASAEQKIQEPLAVDDYNPSVYYLNALRAVVREAGYQLAGPILSDPDVRRWVLPAAGSRGDFWPWGTILPARAERAAAYTHFSQFAGTNTAYGFDESCDMAVFSVSADTTASGGTRALNTPETLYTAPKSGAYSFAWEATISSATQQIEVLLGQDIYRPQLRMAALGLLVSRSGETLQELGTGLEANPPQLARLQQRLLTVRRLDTPGSDALATGTFAGTATNLYLEAGDTVHLVLLARSAVRNSNTTPLIWRERLDVTFSGGYFACTAFDGPTLLNPAAVLPDIAQKDLLRDFLIRTNTVPVVDAERRTVHLLSREEHTQAQGLPITLDDVADPASIEYVPALAGVARVVFQPAEAEDLPPGSDVVAVPLPGNRAGSEKVLSSPFAATQVVTFQSGLPLALACVATAEQLATSRSEASQDPTGAAPRVLLYTPPPTQGAAVQIIFQTRVLQPGHGTYLGTSLAWAGDTGAVARTYGSFLAAATRGHLCRVSCSLTPALYKQLSPGRRVYLLGAEYSIESISGFDPDAVAGLSQLELLRRV